MAETKTKPAASSKASGAKKAEGRKFTPRKPLAAKDEKRLASVTKAFEGESAIILKRSEEYARKVLKHAAGLRATPAPRPVEMSVEQIAKVHEILGIADPKVEAAKEKNGAKPIAGEPA